MKLLAAILITGGCVSGGSLPEEWGPLYRGEDLESRLAGCYDCDGRMRVPDSYYSRHLGLGHFVRAAGCEFVVIEHSQEGLLRLTFHFPDRPDPKIREFARGDGYKKRGEWVLLKKLRDFETGGIVAAWTSEAAALAVTERGDLVVRRVDTDVGLIWIIPAGGKSTMWGVFPRIPMPDIDPS